MARATFTVSVRADIKWGFRRAKTRTLPTHLTYVVHTWGPFPAQCVGKLTKRAKVRNIPWLEPPRSQVKVRTSQASSALPPPSNPQPTNPRFPHVPILNQRVAKYGRITLDGRTAEPRGGGDGGRVTD